MKKIFAMTAALALTVGGSVMLAQKAAAAGGDAAKGKQVFEQCSVCHLADSTEKKTGPGLKGLFKKAKLVNGQKVTDQTVTEFIKKGSDNMMGFGDVLSAQEIKDVVAYLKTL
jgi:cytochrome c2